MAMIAVPVPYEVGRLFRSIEVDGQRDQSDHITMLYLGDDVKIDTIAKMVPLIFDITSKQDPFLASCKKITTFPKGDNGYPIISLVDAPQLHDIQKKLKRVLDRKGIKYSDKYPEYKPHVTLGYHKKKTKNIAFPKTQWQINEIAIYGGNNHDEKVYVSFPLSLKVPVKKSADYIFQLANSYTKLAEDPRMGYENLNVFFQQALFNMGLFYQDPEQGGAQSADFANNVWIPTLENTETYGAYDINITVPAGTLSAKFSGSPVPLVNYLNTNIAPKITSGLQRVKGTVIGDYKLAEPPSNVSFKYMKSV